MDVEYLMECLLKYIVDEAMVLVPALMIIGYMLKQTPKIENWMIPWILLILGTIGTVLMLGVTVKGFVQGAIVTGVAVLGHQLWKQTVESKNGKKDELKLPK